jgi:hypothetical protein
MKGIKKHRGLRRYYKNLELRDSNWSKLEFEDPEKAWFDLWHTHFDWNGYGNNSFRKRKPHLDKLFRHFDLLAERAKSVGTEYQIWATLLDFDSYSDALYLHTPNPNRKNFPTTIENLSSKNTLTNKELANYVNNLCGYEKLYGQAEEAFCVLFKKNIGVGMT